MNRWSRGGDKSVDYRYFYDFGHMLVQVTLMGFYLFN